MTRIIPFKIMVMTVIILCFLPVYKFKINNNQYEKYFSRIDFNSVTIPFGPMMSCLKQEDWQLTTIIRSTYLEAPDSKYPEYNLSMPLEMYLEQYHADVAKEVDEKIFKGKLKYGFFVEAGAGDFESRSDSLYYEAKYGWKGILVEPNLIRYRTGKYKRRKSTSINACLSPSNWTRLVRFNDSSYSLEANDTMESNDTTDVVCLPLFSILLAFGNPTVHYFSLDVEGSEFPILKTIPWEKVDIWVLSIETHFAGKLYPGSREELIEYMESKGYDHIPDGHKNGDWFMYDGNVLEVINDMFVKQGIGLPFSD